MSVHGEYSRALETLISCSRALDPETRSDWPERLEGARLARSSDLSAAARIALAALDDLEPIAPSSPPLSAAKAHLRAHCRAILGLAQ